MTTYQQYTRSTRDEEPVDVEFEEVPPMREERREQRRRTREQHRDNWRKAREFFETRAQARWDAHHAEREATRGKMNTRDDLTDREEVSLLRSNIQAAGREYMQSLRKSDVLVPGFEDEQRDETVSALNNVYAQMMVQSCVRPLQRGVNAQSVVRAATMMAAMYMVSPTFRDSVDEHLTPVKEAIGKRLDSATEKLGTVAQARADRANETIGRKNVKIAEKNIAREAEGKTAKDFKKEKSPQEYLVGKWRKRYEDIQFRKRGNREMFTERSAGMTEVALMENAYLKMREPGADSETIKASYEGMVERLYRHAEADGLSRKDVAKASQVVLGERIQEDPRVRTMVDGMSHGWVKMSDPHTERIAGTDETVTVWRGEFEDNFGHSYDQTRYADPLSKEGVQGAFHMRPPQSLSTHQSEMAQTMATTMADSIERGDHKAFNDDLGAYMLGYVAKVNDVDGEGMRGAIPDRLMQSRTMLGAMTADGFSESKQRFAYSNAYVDAIEAVQEAYPDFAEQWNATYGENWQDFMRSAVADPVKAQRIWQAEQTHRTENTDASSKDGTAYEAQDEQAESEPEFQA